MKSRKTKLDIESDDDEEFDDEEIKRKKEELARKKKAKKVIEESDEEEGDEENESDWQEKWSCDLETVNRRNARMLLLKSRSYWKYDNKTLRISALVSNERWINNSFGRIVYKHENDFLQLFYLAWNLRAKMLNVTNWSEVGHNLSNVSTTPVYSELKSRSVCFQNIQWATYEWCCHSNCLNIVIDEW